MENILKNDWIVILDHVDEFPFYHNIYYIAYNHKTHQFTEAVSIKINKIDLLKRNINNDLLIQAKEQLQVYINKIETSEKIKVKTLNHYQELAKGLDIYPTENCLNYFLHSNGIANEAGEVLGKIKKAVRDNYYGKYEELNLIFKNQELKQEIKKELGDVLWYIANLAKDFDISLEEVATENINKLYDRKKRGKIQGNGDSR